MTVDEASNPDDDVWYGTPAATILKSKRRQDDDEASLHEETRLRQDKEDRKRRRVEAKRQKSKPMVIDEEVEVSEPKAPLAAVSVQNNGPQVPENPPSPRAIISRSSPHEEQLSGGSVDLQASFRLDGVVYTALKDIQIGQLANLIGIVTMISEPSRTRSGDWMRFVHIVDPSNQGSRGLKINCFTKKYREWLPHPEGWHVLILRNVKVQCYHDTLVGTVISNKLLWAAFSPSTNSIYHGQLENVPREEGLVDGGFGVLFSPFYEPKEGELRYCSKLSDWWRLQNIEQSGVDVVRNLPPRRVHRLISEAGPSVQPNGYFDCTVEILNEFLNFNGVHTIYVTDYTHNNQMAGVQSSWCPPSLSDFVLQMEMWDDAAEVARTMREGEYYLIKNARMRANHHGYLEGKVTQSKIVQLEETEAETNIHLQSLLERKKIWSDKQLAKPDTEIEHQLIQDVEGSIFFHCTVELVHADYGTSDIYVTDYTSHPRLGIVAVGKPWSKGLEKCIARIRLSEQQKHIAESAVVGDFYIIKKLRLKYSPTEECFRGFLGGTEKLIQGLNRNNTDNVHLNGLIRRRKAWQQKMDQLHQGPSVSPTRPSLTRPSLTAPLRQSYTHIKDIGPDDTSIQKYRISARAVDFYPLKLEDAFYQFCKHCNVEVPKSQKACFGCSDFEHEHIQYLYQLYVMIEDEDGKQIMVSINDECPLLEGLERVYMPNDKKAFSEFQSRLKPLLGNLTMVHSALLSEKKVEINSAFGVYEVDSWVISNGKRAFCLVGHDQNVTAKS